MNLKKCKALRKAIRAKGKEVIERKLIVKRETKIMSNKPDGTRVQTGVAYQMINDPTTVRGVYRAMKKALRCN